MCNALYHCPTHEQAIGMVSDIVSRAGAVPSLPGFFNPRAVLQQIRDGIKESTLVEQEIKDLIPPV